MKERLFELLKQGNDLPCGNGYPWKEKPHPKCPLKKKGGAE